MAETKQFQILVAEDSPGDIALVREALKHHGLDCEIDVISDGVQVIGYLRGLDVDPRAAQPDLVLLDMHLPKCDGEDILKVLRSTERIAQTPVVIMTSSLAPEVEAVAQKHAAMHYFIKPSTWSEFSQLGDIVRKILEGRKPGETAPTANGAEGSI